MLKIAHKIIFIYSAITLCAIGMAFAVLSYWMSDYADNLYYSFLEERAELIAQKNLERCSGNRVYNVGTTIIMHLTHGNFTKIKDSITDK